MKVKVQNSDDLWYLRRVVRKDDLVSGVTFRKVVVGEKEGERKRVFLKIKVEKISFHDFSEVLKLLGVIIESRDERIPIGEHHSFNVGVNDEVIIEKEWTSIDKNYLQRSKSIKSVKLMLVACDYGAIMLHPEKKVVFVCDLCEGNPKCIEWCPEEALDLVTKDTLAQKARIGVVKKLFQASKES